MRAGEREGIEATCIRWEAGGDHVRILEHDTCHSDDDFVDVDPE